MESLKRVACLYRVSTKGQVEKDDIPMQKTACRDFIDKQGNWKLVKEYAEKGVSGFKVSAKKRDELIRVQADAQAGLFDILLVFMFDRLGRKDDESPFVVEWFVKQGIEVWSVKEGQQKFDNHSDKLINYLRFWQSSGESIKTSMRVEEKHTQMVKEGLFRGGKAPYGYQLVKSGEVNKKGKDLFKLAIDEEESKVIKEIFNLVYNEGYGGNRIAKHLNDNDIPSKTGKSWSMSVINFVLRNPVYKGYMVYGKRTGKDGTFINQKTEDWIMSEKPIEELIIIQEEVWDRVQEIRSSRTPDKIKNQNAERIEVSKSPLLFTGLIKCGHCGSPLTTTYHDKKWTTKDGTEKYKRRVKYRCSGKAQNKTNCDGQTLYAQEKIEITVLEEVKKCLDEVAKTDITEQVDKYEDKNITNRKSELKKLQEQNEQNYEELNILNKEVPKSIMGKSSFKPELLNQLIEDKELEIKILNEKISTLQNDLVAKKSAVNEYRQFQKHIPKWWEEFNNGTIEKQKMMLKPIIEYIIVSRDGIEVKIDVQIQEFLSAAKKLTEDLWVQNKHTGEYNYAKNIPHKFLEKLIEIKFTKTA